MKPPPARFGTRPRLRLHDQEDEVRLGGHAIESLCQVFKQSFGQKLNESDNPGVNECWIAERCDFLEVDGAKGLQATRRRTGFSVIVHGMFQAIILVLSGYLLNTYPTGVEAAIHSPVDLDWARISEEARNLQPAPGLVWKVWAAEPQLANGVSFSFDRTGQCYIAETHRYGKSIFDITQQTAWLTNDLSFRTANDRRGFLEKTFQSNPEILTHETELVRCLSDPDHSGHATETEVTAAGFNSVLDGTAAGILADGTNLWFGNIPNLWKMDRGVGSVTKRVIATGFGVHIGVTGHDLHGLTLGPDGRLYMSFGDRGVCLTNWEGHVVDLPDTGGVLRCNGDGSELEVYCTGLRNPQELAFDDWGNLWTVDNDTAGEDPCRVLYLLRGADYGWRCSYQHQEGFGPWVQEEFWRGYKEGILPPVGTVSQGPSGLAWYPGTGFGTRLAGRFLHCDFPKGVLSFSVVADGAGFKIGQKDRFLWNCWSTDVDFGPDGAAYVLDWVQGWQMPNKGRIYRVTDPRFIDQPEVKEVHDILVTGMEQRGLEELAEFLGHRDRRIRMAAQSEWVRRNPPSRTELIALATANGSILGRIHALWTLEELNRLHPSLEDLRQRDASIAKSLEHADPEFIGQALLMLAHESPELLAQGIAMALQHREPRLHLQVTLAVAECLRSKGGTAFKTAMPVEKFRALLQNILPAHPGDAWIEHGVVLALTAWDDLQEGKNASEIAHWLSDEAVVLRRAGLLAARHQALAAIQKGRPMPTVNRVSEWILPLLNDRDATLVEEAGRAVYELPLAPAYPALAKLLTRIDLPSGLATRVIAANLRLGSPQFAQAVASYALRQDAPPRARAKALEALGEWGHPSPIDRVNGLWRPLVTESEGGGAQGELGPVENRVQRKLASEASSPFPGARYSAGQVPLLPIDLGRNASYDLGIAVKRNEAAARRAFLRVAGQILDPSLPDANGVAVGGPLPPEEVQLAVIQAASGLHTKEASHPLAAHFRRSDVTPKTKAAIMEVLVELNGTEAMELIREALGSPTPELKATAIACLSRLDQNGSVEFLGQIIRDSLTSPETSPKAAQAALSALGGNSTADSAALLLEFLDRWQHGQWPQNLLLDLWESVRHRPEAEFRQKTLEFPVRLELKPEREAWKPWLSGGDRQRGAKIFRENPTIQCSRCHRVGNDGGTVGPSLDGIGKRASPTEILESIAFPNARIAPGFESVVLQLKSGQQIVGVIKRESADQLDIEVQLEDGQLRTEHIEKKSVDLRQGAPSAMPEGLDRALNALELRDLVEYVSSIR